jgi:hypothetical protein
MYLRCNRRFKDGKEHCYWNIVEAKRCAGGRVVQRKVLSLGEVNDSEREAWCRVIEAAFKNLKDDLQLRPIYHQLESRIEAHIFVAFMAYCLHITLRAQLKPLAADLTSRAVLDNLAGIHMLDVHFPTTDGRTLILSRYTEPNPEQRLLVERLNLTLPPQPPPRITAAGQLVR